MQYHEVFTLDYFLKKFESVPEEYFSLSTELNPTDAWEWIDTEDEKQALFEIVRPWGILSDVNDGEPGYEFFGDNPKERVVGFLTYVKQNRIPYLSY